MLRMVMWTVVLLFANANALFTYFEILPWKYIIDFMYIVIDRDRIGLYV